MRPHAPQRAEQVAEPRPEQQPATEASELFKTFEFASFTDAMAFMYAATPHISEVQHHPQWMNRWRTVTVSLTTWDIGSRVSPIDVDLARYLDELRLRWPPAPQ